MSSALPGVPAGHMRALYLGSGSTWELRTVPVPTVAVGQVLIRVAAVALNNADVAALDRQAQDRGEPQIAGYEAAGRVVAVGAGVDSALLGQRVMTSTTRAFADLVVADVRHTLPVPDRLTDAQAATLPTALLTEHGALRAGGFHPGQSVLLTGATSAIGLVGMQVAKALGASQVLATTRTGDKRELLASHGADVVIDTTQQSLVEAVHEATDGQGVDLVLDHIGGRTFNQTLAALRQGGTLVQIGRLDAAEATIDLDTLAYRHVTVRGVSFGAPDQLAELLSRVSADVLPAVVDARIEPVLDVVLSFDRADEAADRVRAGRARGKVVLQLSG